ncbi:MAG TPA: ABC transporter permease [Candidatus Dormibacteraeota bacterium]|nr:ABC transporter permease [Candidatus Dormibacteraeota bacterium]
MSAQAQIADRRFQHYVGERRGAGYSFFSLLLHSIGWVLGLKRSSRYKIIPALVLLSTYLPAAAFVLVVTVAPPGTPLPKYSDFYAFTVPAIYLFIALTMPELICPDRRHGTLRMYMTSNLNPATYLAAKVAAAWSVLAIVTVIPVVIQLLSYSLFGHGPANAGEWFKTLAQIIGAGLELAIFYGTIALALSSLTDRNSFAAAGIILTFVLSGAALGILQGPLKAPAWVLLVNVNQLPTELISRIYQLKEVGTVAGVPTWEVAAAAAGWVLAGLAVLAIRYSAEGRR